MARTDRRKSAGVVARRARIVAALTLVISALFLFSRHVRATAAPARLTTTDGVAKMAILLKDRAAQVNPLRLQFIVNEQRALLMGEKVKALPPSPDRLVLQVRHATELLNAGHIEEALKVLAETQTDALALDPDLWKQARPRVLMLKAMAYMRQAEEENCCQQNNSDSCLMPLKGQGLHKKREGATHAIAVLTEILELTPDNLRARWLLNVAQMTLGRYPDGVPKAQLIPPKIFESEYPLPRFDNVAKKAGVGVFGLSGGAVLDDLDNDGRLDLVISHLGFSDQTRVFHNRGDGTFEDRTEASGIVGETGGLNMNHTDYNNDGLVDILILRGGWMAGQGLFPLSLLRNNGDGTFADVTVDAGLLRLAPSQTATWFDYDGDGWLDLYVGNESAPNDTSFPCQLYHNNRDGTFTDRAKEIGVDFVGYVKGVTAGDYDNDGRPDLYLSTQLGDNVLFHNDGAPKDGGAWRFTNVASAAGVTAQRSSFGTFFFDYDNDGWQDLFVAGYASATTLADDVTADRLGLPTEAERNRLFHNEGNGTFKDVTQETGLYKVVAGMGLNFGDLDNDGWLDFYQGTGNPDLSSIVGSRMFRNDGGRRFQDVTSAGNFGHLQKGHAIAFGDVDNDGDQDVYAEMGGAYSADTAYSALYKNPGNTNAWLGLSLVGEKSNRKAVGARLKVVVETKAGPRTLYRVVTSGGSFGSNPFRQQIGLGDATRVTSVEVFWPATGKTQRLAGLGLRQWYEVHEGVDAAKKLDLPRFAL